MEVETAKISELKPHPKNPRVHPDSALDKLVKSIKEFGWTNPVLLSKDGIILAGHARVKAAQKAGLDEVPVIRLPLEGERADAYLLADNKLQDETEWDMDKLKDVIEDLSEQGFDLDLTGFDASELDDIMQDLKGESEIIEDEPPEPPEEPITRPGDLWILGRHRLLCGDATVTTDVDRLMDGKKADMVFTDPPYEIDTRGGGILKTANSMKQIRENKVDSFDPERLVLWSDTNIYCHNKPLIKKYIELAERNKVSYDLAFYKKPCTVPNYKGHLMTDCEYIAIIGKQDPNKGLEKECYSKCYTGSKDPENKMSYSKPVGLCAKFIKLYSKGNVLDLFGGSGSTLIAAEQLNRICYMMELDPKYCDVIIQRWENLTGKKAELSR